LYSHWGLSAQNSIARACKVAGIAATQKHTLHLPKAAIALVQMDFTHINFNRHVKDYSIKFLTIYQYL
jgi:hypothetical protein